MINSNKITSKTQSLILTVTSDFLIKTKTDILILNEQLDVLQFISKKRGIPKNKYILILISFKAQKVMQSTIFAFLL